MIAEYVDQIRAAQSGDDRMPTCGPACELEMVREQAIRDVAHMREQLAAAETQKRRLQQADGREAISHEAMRQQIEVLESSLAERQRELGNADGSQQMLEDRLEDANRQLDEIGASSRRPGSRRTRRYSADARRSRHAISCRRPLYRLQEDAEEARVTDLRDDRLKPSRRPIGIDSVAAPSRFLPGLLGAGVVLALLGGAQLLYRQW